VAALVRSLRVSRLICSGLLARQEKLIAVEQRERPQVALGDVPDLALRVGHDKIALAGHRRVVGAEHFIDEGGVEMGFVDWMRMRDLARGRGRSLRRAGRLRSRSSG